MKISKELVLSPEKFDTFERQFNSFEMPETKVVHYFDGEKDEFIILSPEPALIETKIFEDNRKIGKMAVRLYKSETAVVNPITPEEEIKSTIYAVEINNQKDEPVKYFVEHDQSETFNEVRSYVAIDSDDESLLESHPLVGSDTLMTVLELIDLTK